MTTDGGDSRCSDLASRRLLVAFDAVLNTHQLPEVRHSIGDRLATVSPERNLDCQIVVQELCLAVLARSGVCVGLRLYDCAGVIRVEVDEPAGTDPSHLHTAHGIVEALSARHGDGSDSAGVRTGVDPRTGVSTAWCELDAGAGRLTSGRRARGGT